MNSGSRSRFLHGFLLLTLLTVVTGRLFADPATARINDVPRKPAGQDIYITDLGHLINARDRASLQSYLQRLDQQNIAQIAILTVPDSDRDLALFAHQIFNSWGIGHRQRNDGILILVNARRAKAGLSGNRIYVAVGYGLEGVLPDGLVGNVLDNRALPAFARKDYSEGIRRTAMILGMIVAGDRELAATFRKAEGSPFSMGYLVFIILISVVWLLVWASRNGSGPGSGGGSGDFFERFPDTSDRDSGGGFGGGSSGGGGAGR